MPRKTKKLCNCRCIKRIYRYLKCLLPNRCKKGIINQTDDQTNHDDNTKEIIPIEIIETLSDVNISPEVVSNQPLSQKSYTKEDESVNSETSDSTSSDDDGDKMRVRRLSIFIDNEYIRNSRNISEPLQSSTDGDHKLCLDKNTSDKDTSDTSDKDTSDTSDKDTSDTSDKDTSDKDTSDEDISDNKSEIIVNIEPQCTLEDEQKVKQD